MLFPTAVAIHNCYCSCFVVVSVAKPLCSLKSRNYFTLPFLFIFVLIEITVNYCPNGSNGSLKCVHAHDPHHCLFKLMYCLPFSFSIFFFTLSFITIAISQLVKRTHEIKTVDIANAIMMNAYRLLRVVCSLDFFFDFDFLLSLLRECVILDFCFRL